ncbi:hypothetical protein [Hymenobacter sp. BT559]|uniref:hypothetical protein n=1 Tax=Hymenobacter sp. BT559 TaxID=2795729 RepID=UPI0018EB4135|nr:hypothetical protein [Hymenobacter sp. BT559]MBJ6146372.1 hypothetical protein [Hymenobacter sp. BT559]
MSIQLAPIVGPEATSILIVLKAKLKNQLLYAEFTEQHDEEASPRAFTMQGTELVHSDLHHRFSYLVPHLCLLTEQLPETDDFWPEDEATELPEHFACFSVTGFSMGRGQAGVTLIGQRQLAGGKVLNLTSPYLALEDENTTYPYAGRLETAVLDAISEVEQALRGKCSEAGRQLDLFDAADPDQEPRLLQQDEAREYVPEVLAEPQPVKKRKANRIAK